jgi:hypothetical protein
VRAFSTCSREYASLGSRVSMSNCAGAFSLDKAIVSADYC